MNIKNRITESNWNLNYVAQLEACQFLLFRLSEPGVPKVFFPEKTANFHSKKDNVP